MLYVFMSVVCLLFQILNEKFTKIYMKEKTVTGILAVSLTEKDR